MSDGISTILLVEDEPAMLTLCRQLLEGLGYTVLAARTPGEALRTAREHTGAIHLLLTDVIMPEMNGRDLATTIAAVRPSIKLLAMSGYRNGRWNFELTREGRVITGTNSISSDYHEPKDLQSICLLRDAQMSMR